MFFLYWIISSLDNLSIIEEILQHRKVSPERFRVYKPSPPSQNYLYEDISLLDITDGAYAVVTPAADNLAV